MNIGKVLEHIKKRSFFKSINMKILTAIITINISIIVVLSFFTYKVVMGILIENYSTLVHQTFSEALNKVDALLDRMDRYLLLLMNNPEVMNIISESDKPEINYSRVFSDQVGIISATDWDTFSFGLYSFNGKSYHYPFIQSFKSIDDLYSSKILEKDKLMPAKVYWTSTYSSDFHWGDAIKATVVSGSRYFNDPYNSSKFGVLMVNIKEDTIYQYIRNIKPGNGSVVSIINEKGMVISSTDRNSVAGIFEDGIPFFDSYSGNGYSFKKIKNQQLYVLSTGITKTGWRIVATIPENEILSKTDSIKEIAFIAGIISILLSMIVSYLVSSRITKPIREITRVVKQIEKGNLDLSCSVNTMDELKTLGDGINKMSRNLKDMINKSYIEEIRLKQAQLESLQAKINPHFLYNTLDNIYWMLIIARQNDIAHLIVALSGILKYGISGTDNLVTVRQELEQVKDYLYIMMSRYKGKLDVKYEMEESIMENYLPKLIIQPLVENAIKHGLESKPGNGEIVLKGYFFEEEIHIEVNDNGIGMDEDAIGRLLDVKEGGGPVKKTGIGLRNVNERVKLAFGKNYGLSIVSKPGEGTCILITLPIVKKDMEVTDEDRIG